MSSQTVFAPWTDPTQKPLIRFQGVTKRFGDFTAVDNIDLDIYTREFFALLGPSGCGKTTLMRMLAGFETPTEGTILLDGQDMAPVPPNKRSTNMMFQSYALFPHLSVRDNIAFGLKREGKPKDEIHARVEEMLRLVQLQKFAARKPHQISGGQRQRVALARSLAKAPKLLLLDEPLGALDKKLREETQFELMDIQEKTGTTFVIVTHDQEEAMTVASRVAVMDAGQLKQVATPPQIYENPNSVYVADFIGEVTIIEGTVRKDGEVYAMDWAEGQPPIRIRSALDLTDGSRGYVAVRPEKVEIHMQKPEDDNVLRGKIIDIGYLGNLSTYHVELANGQIIRAQNFNTERSTRQTFTWEDEVWVNFTTACGVLLES
ncbi:ABC transporter ATP-binding protein [Psychromarinibacter halotolerans]|uniref:Spermidine/putrescine import ATP-binding protein PotA n=1 Tax=Psychromarinibacter halotolerans TaxID=1775175 RepID=A0ABV7GNM2_9RHOB|nr:ABC transporter ATP-binding protein [Psychromarinibacter halotolerans]MDF0596983.1 ABC transporter ATP-binding protein [Psychromarinibacter halotolerans]